MTRQTDTQTLVESFCALADEVQNLTDRKTILEHKLRFAAEQYQQLADKYALATPEVADTLANLQVPPDQHVPPSPSSYVPLPKRGQAGCNQHQIALLIRDGRRAAQQLSALPAHINTSGTGTVGAPSKEISGAPVTTMSTIMEQDFTVEGKKGMLDCPFSTAKREQQLQRQKQQLEQENQQLHITGGLADADDDHDGADTADAVAAVSGTGASGTAVENDADAVGGANKTKAEGADGVDPTPHNSTDPICSAMFEESTSQQAPSSTGAARCPIRFLDQHSPEEVAHYVETHKHQLPRSHAICLRRYNKSEQQIRKIDAKYGNLVNMISGLGQFHQPMLASAEPGAPGDPEEVVDRAALHRDSHERVKTWANNVSASGAASGQDPNYDGDDDEAGTDRRGRHSLSNSPDNSHENSRRESSGSGEAGPDGDNTELDRQSHFDRPLKEVRLGESPSRPWGIAVPIMSLPHAEAQPPLSPPAAPVRMPSPLRAHNPVPRGRPAATQQQQQQPARKCPFDHTKFGLGVGPPPGHAPVPSSSLEKGTTTARETDDEDGGKAPSSAQPMAAAQTERPCTPMKGAAQQPPPQNSTTMPQLSQTTWIPSSTDGPQYPQEHQQKRQPTFSQQPAFVNFPPQSAPGTAGNLPKPAHAAPTTGAPQMVFTGPVFIGYPMEQAIQFMQHFQNLQSQ